MDIMVAVCEIKKVTAWEDNFWERDVNYVIKNNGIHTYFNEMKKVLFQLQGYECKFSIKYFTFGDDRNLFWIKFS